MLQGAYLPLRESNSRRSILSVSIQNLSFMHTYNILLVRLDWLDKHNAERVPDSYSLTISYFNFIDATKSLSKLLSENGQIGKFREPENEENGGNFFSWLSYISLKLLLRCCFVLHMSICLADYHNCLNARNNNCFDFSNDFSI